MFFYNKTNPPAGKTLLARHNAKQLRNFKLNQEHTQEELIIWTPSKVPGVLRNLKHRRLKYTKDWHSDSLALIFKEKEFDSWRWQSRTAEEPPIFKDKEFDSFQWRISSSEQLRDALRWGIIKTQSVTGQVIAALGQYRLVALERIKNGLVSNRYSLKEKLLNHYQARFEALEKLESLANRDSDEKALEQAIGEYCNTLSEITDFKDIPSIQEEIAADIKYAQQFFNDCKNKSFQRATGINSILTFVKTQMIRSLRQLQNHNQNITYSREMPFAMTRGDLNSCIEDAEKIIEDYIAWPHDAVTANHHGRYKIEKGIIYDSSYHCSSSQDEQRALLAITFIEKQNILDLSDSKNPKILTADKVINLQQIKATKWEVGGGWLTAFEKTLAWVANIGIKLVVGLIELPLTLLIEPLTFGYLEDFFDAVREIATYEISIKNPSAPLLVKNNLLEKTQRKPQTLGLRIKHFAVVAFKNTLEDAFYGIRDIYKQFSVHLFDSVINDYLDGKELPKLEDVINDTEKDIKDINENKKITDDFQEIKYVSRNAFAEPLFVTNTGEFNDILNSSADGVEAFTALYLHNIYAKHPFTSMLFSFTYVVGGLAVLAPHSVAFLGSQYLAYSQAMGHSMSKGPFTAAISSAITQAQMTSSAFELLIHGHDSWIVKGAIEFEKDPFTSLCYVGTALGLGYALLHMPAVGAVLKEDMGTFPPSSLVFVGAKLGILVYELLMEHQELELEKTVSATKLKKYITQIYSSTSNDNAEIELKVNKFMTILLDAENIQALQASYDQLEQQNIKIIEAPHKSQDFNKLQMQYKILTQLMKNQQHLPSLSVKTKHQWTQQLNAYFPADQARSLNKMLYPEEATSILRTTLKVIFSYPAFAARIFAATISSMRWGNLHPLYSAGTDFGLKILKDITRVGRAFNKFCKVGFIFARRLAKTVADIFVNSFLARAQALIANSHAIANAGYAASAAIDVNYEKTRQFLSAPVDAAVKKVTTSHPVDVNKKVTASYVKMLRELLVVNDTLKKIPVTPMPEISEKIESESINADIEPQETYSWRPLAAPGR